MVGLQHLVSMNDETTFKEKRRQTAVRFVPLLCFIRLFLPRVPRCVGCTRFGILASHFHVTELRVRKQFTAMEDGGANSRTQCDHDDRSQWAPARAERHFCQARS